MLDKVKLSEENIKFLSDYNISIELFRKETIIKTVNMDNLDSDVEIHFDSPVLYCDSRSFSYKTMYQLDFTKSKFLGNSISDFNIGDLSDLDKNLNKIRRFYLATICSIM